MDKRWILILIIFIVGCSCLYTIVNSSTTVGDAITVVNKTIVTLPPDFSIGNDDKDSVTLINENKNESILITDLGKLDIASERFNNDIDTFQQSDSVQVVSSSTFNIGNITTFKISIQNWTSAENTYIVYSYTCKHTFSMEFKGYSDENALDEDLNFLISTISPDFKQNQD